MAHVLDCNSNARVNSWGRFNEHVINYDSGKPANPLRGYSYVHDSQLQQPRQVAATMHKILSVTTVIVHDSLY